MDGFFSFFGKFAIVVVVMGLLVGGGYYLGTGKLPFPMNPTPAAVTTVAPQTSPTSTVIPTSGVSPTAASSQTVTGGGPRGTSFSPFTITVPAGWTVKKDEVANVSYTLTISQGAYSIAIYQAATGGGGCLYPGDPPQEMSSQFGAYVTIHDSFGNEFRRATPAGSASGFTVCQKGPTFFGLPTMYGHVTYTTPATPDASILAQMDAMFATLKN